MTLKEIIDEIKISIDGLEYQRTTHLMIINAELRKEIDFNNDLRNRIGDIIFEKKQLLDKLEKEYEELKNGK